MKRIMMLGIVFISLICLVGCGSSNSNKSGDTNSLSCKSELSNDNETDTIFYFDRNDKAISCDLVMIYTDKDEAKKTYDLLLNNMENVKIELDGKKVKIKSAYKSKDLDLQGYIGKSKEEIKEYFEEILNNKCK